MKSKLTKSFIKNCTSEGKAQKWYPDHEYPQLLLRVFKSSRKSWVVRSYEFNTSKVIGNAFDMDIRQARVEARKIISEMTGEKDWKFIDIFEIWKKEKLVLLKPKTQSTYGDTLKYILPMYGNLKMKKINRGAIYKLRDEVKKSVQRKYIKKYGKEEMPEKKGEPMANRCVTTVQSILSFAYDKRYISGSSFIELIKLKKFVEIPRGRRANNDEFMKIIRAINEEQNISYWGCYWTLLLTACRREEARTMRREDVDLVKREWRRGTSKNGEPLILKLSLAHVEGVLKKMPHVSEYFFPGESMIKPINGFNKNSKRLWERAGVEGIYIHDLRRTIASVLSDEGIHMKVISELLNHKKTSTTERYVRPISDEKVRAIELISEKIGEKIQGPFTA